MIEGNKQNDNIDNVRVLGVCVVSGGYLLNVTKVDFLIDVAFKLGR